MTGDLELSRRLTDAVSCVAGVSGVYPASSPAVSLARTIAAGLVDAARDAAPDSVRDDGVDDAKVAITRTETGALSVAATIGVDADHPVPQVLRAVGDAVRGVLDAEEPGAPPPVIEVRASHIDARSIGG